MSNEMRWDGIDNNFVTTLSSGISASDLTVYLNRIPYNPSKGYLVLDADNIDKYEIIHFSAVGDNYVSCPADLGRGQGGTSAVSHDAGAVVKMYLVANHLMELYMEVLYNTPVGVMHVFAGSSAPTGWLLTNGAAVSRIEYADLFGVIGTTFGAGDGSTTFNLPNPNGRVIVGYDGSQTEFNAIGKTSGAKTHTLNWNEMPVHNHADSGHGHSSGVDGASILVGDGTIWNHATGAQARGAITGGVNTGYANIANAGGGQAHNNLQPGIAMNYIIKY